ncbi:hypothetical protein BDZ94DRAFT_1265787 [Collybia nuda]|uniref:Uncharacterized protein n=1 Tax=Collybia nuda TaxID=64659 RepID=A0A9P5Y1I9_9AGAR|nr:hypothetical protein BDZ94DRAFT_1265787 [Collybia nuda]
MYPSKPLTARAPLNPAAIPFVPPTQPVQVEHKGPTFWSPLQNNPIPIATPPNKGGRRRLRALTT